MTIRILHVIPGLGHGGAEHQLLMNIEHLDSAKFESHVYNLHDRTILAPALEEAGAKVHSGVVSGRLAAPRRLWKLTRLVRELKPDLIHTSNVVGEMYGGLAGRMTGVPVVGTLTNTSDRAVRLADNPHLNSFKLNTVGFLRRQLVRRTHRRHIAISKHVGESAIKELGIRPDRISVIYRGIDSKQSEADSNDIAELRRELGLDDGAHVILTVGRLVPQKGQRYLVDAMPAVIEQYPGSVLLIVGIGFLEEKLKSQVSELGLEKHVRFLGRREDVPALMQLADTFVFPSLFEGLGVSLLEACDSGTAIVATNTGPIPEIIRHGETGLLVPPADHESLAAAILELMDDSELGARLAEAAANRVRREFTIDRAAGMLSDFYETTIGHSANGLHETGLSEAR
jgi:glycosyltransferase involved in cell wall biosynthesis